jgi:hypothetical protein
MGPDRPLDALLPALRRTAIPFQPVHPRVLEVGDDPDHAEWVLTWWGDLNSERELFGQVQKLVEATLLSELSQPARLRRERRLRYTSMRLVQMHPFRGDAERCLRPFGFARSADEAGGGRGLMPFVAREADQVGVALPPEAHAVWRSGIRPPAGELGVKLGQVEQMLADRLGDDVFGATPGGPSRLAARYIEEVFHTRIEPTLEGLRTLEMLLVQSEPGAIRWIPPLLFQALCDFIGVLGESVYARRVAWAVSELDGDFAPPPLLRLDLQSGRHVHIPIGTHLLRWCVMPLQPGEVAASLADWAEDQFAGAEA